LLSEPRSSSRPRGVGHEDNAVTGVRGADARSREYRRPAGVTDSFQVSENKVEPRPSSRAFNLFPKDRVRAMLADVPEPGRPEMPVVGEPASFAGGAERLARARSGPDALAVGPAGGAERGRPDADPSKEMNLANAGQLSSVEVSDARIVDDAGGEPPVRDEVAEPVANEKVIVIIKNAHFPYRAISAPSAAS
jgi:hypothetical protein